MLYNHFWQHSTFCYTVTAVVGIMHITPLVGNVSWRIHGEGRMPNLFRQCQWLDALLTHKSSSSTWQLSSSNGVYYTSEHSSLLLLLSHPLELSMTRRHHSWVTCLLKIPLLSRCPFYRTTLSTTFLLTSTTIVETWKSQELQSFPWLRMTNGTIIVSLLLLFR